MKNNPKNVFKKLGVLLFCCLVWFFFSPESLTSRSCALASQVYSSVVLLPAPLRLSVLLSRFGKCRIDFGITFSSSMFVAPKKFMSAVHCLMNVVQYFKVNIFFFLFFFLCLCPQPLQQCWEDLGSKHFPSGPNCEG